MAFPKLWYYKMITQIRYSKDNLKALKLYYKNKGCGLKKVLGHDAKEVAMIKTIVPAVQKRLCLSSKRFLAQKSLITETIEVAGHRCIFIQSFTVNSITLSIFKEQQGHYYRIHCTIHRKASGVLYFKPLHQ